jgi:hypothetical protein
LKRIGEWTVEIIKRSDTARLKASIVTTIAGGLFVLCGRALPDSHTTVIPYGTSLTHRDTRRLSNRAIKLVTTSFL